MDDRPDSAARQGGSRFGMIFWTCLVVGVLLGLTTALRWSAGEWTGETQGYAFGCILLPAVVAYVVAGRKKVRNPDLFGLDFCGLCLLFLALELLQQMRR